MTGSLRRQWVSFKRLLWAVYVRLRPSAGEPQPARVEQRHVNGYQMLVCTNEAVGRGLRLFGEYEPEETALLRETLRPNDTCVDVGANLGYFTLLMARQAPDGAVHAFEPIPRNYHLLRASLELNGYANVTVSPHALAAERGRRTLHIAADSGYSSFVDTARQPVERTIEVDVTTLDAYVSERAIARVDVLKVDVEGAEREVLRGAHELLGDRGRRPRLVLLELYEPMLRQYGTSIGEVVADLDAIGYAPFVLDRGDRVSFTPERHDRFYNVCFAPVS